ncbi:MAG: hypothetical protein ACK47B_01620 [Armatimonadota bacterium]
MQTIQCRDEEERERAVRRVLMIGQPIRSIDELAGPDSVRNDPNDLAEFLAFLEEQRQPVRVTDDVETE